MKKILLLFLMFTLSAGFSAQSLPERKPIPKKLSAAAMKAGALIDVNAAGYAASTYTPTQLVKDVLISSGTSTCLIPQVSNVTVTPNTAVTDTNRAWGYFHKGTTNFPFTDGIILSTGYARKAGNTPQTDLNDAIGTNSDPDLVAATNPPGTLNDAVLLEFDFIPTTSLIKFNYLMASQEYTGTFPCNYADAFALLLRPVGSTAPYTNMAVLPNNAGPVSVTNIRPAIGSSCGAVNPQYFAGYNTTNIETNFNGRTVPLTATATVTPGVAYHFKMVIADYGDRSFDSAVFLEGGSFNIGVDLLDANGATLPEEINVCDNVPQVITASVSDPTLTYQWFFNGTPIPGATTNTITATQPGTYTIEVSAPGNPCPGKASIKINGGTTPQAQDGTFLLCATPDITTFDLNGAKPLLSTTPGAVFRFYANQADALAQNNNNIQNISNYNGTNNQILYVVVSDGGFCSKTVKLTLKRETTPIAAVSTNKVRICQGESVTLTASNGVTYQWNNFPGTGNTQTVTLFQTTTFSVYAIGALGCKSLQPATVTVEVVPEPSSQLQDVEVCIGDSVTLDAGGAATDTYLWNTGATTKTITVNQLGIYSVVINNGICSKSYTAKVVAAASPFISATNYANKTLTVTAYNPPINNTAGTLEYSLDGITWQQSNIFTNLTDNTAYNVRVRVVGTSCIGNLEVFTFQINNIITPNQDGINDVLDLSALGQFKNFTGAVYDRYGVELFRFTKDTPIWNGSVGGKRLSTATYWYKFNFEYEKSKTQMNYSGWIMLKNRE